MIVNFKAHKISRGARKLTRTPTLIIKNIYIYIYTCKGKNKEKRKRNRCCLKIKQLIEEGEINKFENYTR
jgi:hypothetical protein